MADVNCALGEIQVTGLQATVLSPDEVAAGRIIVRGHKVDFAASTDGDNTWPGDSIVRTWWDVGRSRTWND